MSKKILLLSLVFLMIFAFNVNLQAQAEVTNLKFTAIASVDTKKGLSVVFSNELTVNDQLDFGDVPTINIPYIARNGGGDFTYATVSYECTKPNWEIKVYTDNTLLSANPGFKDANSWPLFGDMNDGSGLVGDGTKGATTNNSAPIKVWSDCKFLDGGFAKAPCNEWVGCAANQFVPDPVQGEKELYWYIYGQDLGGNGPPDGKFHTNVICSNSHPGWGEAENIGPNPHPDYDANGDGDFLDGVNSNPPNQTLGKVFEYSFWMPVVADRDVYEEGAVISSDYIHDGKTCPATANTAIIMNSELGSGRVTEGVVHTYFAITDDVAGSFKTTELIFELKTIE